MNSSKVATLYTAVPGCSSMHTRQLRILGACEGREIAPVRGDDVGPLAIVDSFEVRQPTTGAEMRGAVQWIATRASSHGYHPVGSQLRRQTNGLA